MNIQENITTALNSFTSNQTSANIGELRKLGIGLKILKNNKWEQLCEYKLPLERFIPLYNDKFEICDIGIY